MDNSSSFFGSRCLPAAAGALFLLLGIQSSLIAEALDQGRAIFQSSEFKALDSYLDKQLKLISTNVSVVVPRLNEVIEALVSLGPDNFATLDGEHDDAGVKFKELLVVKDSEKLLHLAFDFSEASKSCTDQSLSFLVSVTTKDSKSKQRTDQDNNAPFLVRFAEGLLDKCWRLHLDRYVAKLDKAAGKMHNDFFELIEAIANKLSNAQLAKERRARGSITISDNSLPNNQVDKIHSLKLVRLLGREDQQAFVQALKKEFAHRAEMQFGDDDRQDEKEATKLSGQAELKKFKEFFGQMLVEPCRQLIHRMDATLQDIDASGKLYSKSTLKINLIEQNSGNSNFIYMLEMNRICTEMVARLARILKLLEG